MHLTLIAPPWYFKNREEAGQSLSQNLGLGYVAAFARAHGHTVEIIDALAEGENIFRDVVVGNQSVCVKGLTDEVVAARISRDTGLIGISAPFTNHASLVKSLSLKIKERFPGIPVVTGGVYPSTLPQEALGAGIDYAVRGEGEVPMLALLNREAPETIKGLVFRKNGRLIDNGQAEAVEDLNTLPFPARDLLPMERTLALSPRGERDKRSLSVITSRGCPYHCRFCSIHPVCGYKWRPRSPENVVAEIEECQKRFGINHVEFEDDNLTFNIDRAISIFEKLVTLPDMPTWSAHNGIRIDRLNKELLALFKKLGCTRLNLAIESGTEKMLSLMDKKLSLAKVSEVVKICGKLGIECYGFLLVGYPGETEESFQETLRYFRKLKSMGLTWASPFIVKPYRGTPLYDLCKANHYLGPDADERIYFNDDSVAITTPDFTEADVQRWWLAANELNDPAARYARRFKKISRLLPTGLRNGIRNTVKRFFF